MRNLILAIFCLINIPLYLLNPCFAQDQKKPELGEFITWRSKFSLDERLRYEYKYNFDFKDSINDNTNVFFNRLRLSADFFLSDEYLNNIASVFIEGLALDAGSYKCKIYSTTSSQRDGLDLHQAYAAINHIAGSDFNAKIGRQEMKYGKGRLIAAPTWANRIRTFDAGVLRYENKVFYGDLFYGQDVKYDGQNLNRSSTGDYIEGIDAGFQKNKVSPLFEFYILKQILNPELGIVSTKRYTVGPRVQGITLFNIAYDIETPYQFGRVGGTTSGSKDIKAYAFHVDLSKSFKGATLKPNFTIEYNYASGDNDPNDNVSNTFNPLYQSTHESYGLMDFFRWQNMRELALNTTLTLTEKLKITPQVNFLWLASKYDSWYNSSGTALRTKTTGDRDYHVGDEVSLRAYYELNKNLKLEAGYSHFFTGGYVKDTGANNDADWCYSQLSFKY